MPSGVEIISMQYIQKANSCHAISALHSYGYVLLLCLGHTYTYDMVLLDKDVKPNFRQQKVFFQMLVIDELCVKIVYPIIKRYSLNDNIISPCCYLLFLKLSDKIDQFDTYTATYQDKDSYKNIINEVFNHFQQLTPTANENNLDLAFRNSFKPLY